MDWTWGYVVPRNNSALFGRVARFRLDDFSTVQVLNLEATDPLLKGFMGGFTDGTWGYVVPYTNASNAPFGRVARFRLDDFSTVQVLNLGATDPLLKGFIGGFTDGTWGYVVPYSNGAPFGRVARFPVVRHVPQMGWQSSP